MKTCQVGCLSNSFRFPLLALTVCIAAVALAQTSETGLPPFGSFHGSDFELVSLENGNLHIEIPIYTVHQRALPDLTYNFVYDIPGWQIDRTPVTPTTFQWVVAPQPHQLSGWHLLKNEVGPWHVDHDVVPKSCSYVVDGFSYTKTYNVHTNYVLTDTHGTTHPFEVRHVDDATSGGCTDPTGNQNSGVALDGTGFTIAIGSNAYSTTIGTPNNYGPLNGNTFTTSGISETNTTDSNGNLVTTIWTYTDSNGNSQQIRVDYTSLSFRTNFCPLLATDGWPCTESGRSSQLPQKLTLPTGRFYFFTWSTDGNGDLLQLDLPTGGHFAYTYKTYTKFLGITYSGGTDGTGRGTGSPSKHYRARRQVTSRTVSNGITANKWNYNGFTITDPLGNDEVHTYSPFGDPPNPPRYETQILYYQGSSSSGAPVTVKTINKDYDFDVSAVQADAIDHGDINVRLKRETTILQDGKTQSKIETDYEMFQQVPDSSIGGFNVTRLNPTEKREFDWGSGSPGLLLRRTDYAYLHTGNQNYLSRNIVRQVTTTTVYDGNNNPVAQAVNEYDNYSHQGQPMVASNAIAHDLAYDTNFIYRGNVTAVSHWRSTDGAMLTSTNQYDDAGNLLSTIDPLGHKTSYDYTDSWGNGSCTPSGQAKIFATTITNALNQFITKSYNSCTGTLAAVTDLNSNTTTYSYDLVDRPLAVTFPDKGQTAYCYTDRGTDGGAQCTQAPSPLKKLTTQKIDSSVMKTTTAVFDGLGDITQTQLNSDPLGVDYMDTTYDALGRVASVSNPYRSTSDATYGSTQTQYDALSRPTLVTQPDGSVSKVVYDVAPPSGVSGNCITYTDEAGKQRMACSDALGRLTAVFEDPAGLNYETDYQYNALDNLLRVDQKGSAPTTSGQWRTRLFTYDSLSRLVTASNPESGTICYGVWVSASVPLGVMPYSQCLNGYDANGNLLAKSDARGITTSYAYDALNRVTQKTFSNGDPTLTFTYDQSPDPTWGAGSSVGHLVRALKSGLGSHWFRYDAMGRVARTWQCLPSNCSAGASVAAQYDLAGGLTQLTYPSGQIVNYTPDSAGRDVSAIDSGARLNWPTGTTSNTGTTTNFVTAATYGPDSGLTGFISGANTAGGFAGITNTFVYNNRLQLCRTAASSTGAAPTSCTNSFGNVLDLNYDYHPPNTGDNGNVYAVTNYRDTTRSQTFAYDSLNRLISAQTNGTDCTKPTLNPNATEYWGNSYTYDAWGNLLAKTVTKCRAEPLNESADTQNRMHVISGPDYSYDAAGSMTYDVTGGHSYTYDAQSQITQVDSGSTATYTYDAEGHRLRKDSGSSPGTEYVYFGDDIVAEKNVSTGAWTNYVFFDGRRVARQDANGVAYYFSDHLKTADVITDAAGNIKSESDYYPWGGELPFTANDPNHYKFTGKERDSETQLDYFGARYYSNGLGRFVTPDWSATPVPVPYADLTDPQSLNQYSYVRNVPTVKVDADGHDCDTCWTVLNFIAGAANAYGSDNLLGAGRMEQTTQAGKLGAAFGDGAATVQGTFEVLKGSAGEIVGVPLDEVGVGEIIQSASTAQMLHGGATALIGFTHLSKAASESKSGSATHENTQENLDKMKKGNAPAGNDGHPVELHHPQGDPKAKVQPMTRTNHRLGANYKKNHPNTNRVRSRIDRSKAQAQKRAFWKKEHADQTASQK